jgi:hypothetical protein
MDVSPSVTSSFDTWRRYAWQTTPSSDPVEREAPGAFENRKSKPCCFDQWWERRNGLCPHAAARRFDGLLSPTAI